MSHLLEYGDEVAEDTCPICEQPHCSLSSIRDRLAPVKAATAWVLGRTFLWSGGTLIVAIAAGWISP